MNKFLGIVIFVLAAALGLTIWAYGGARFEAGELSCKADAATAAITAGNESAANLDKVMNETARMSDADVDADLVQLGIMRPPHAR